MQIELTLWNDNTLKGWRLNPEDFGKYPVSPKWWRKLVEVDSLPTKPLGAYLFDGTTMVDDPDYVPIDTKSELDKLKERIQVLEDKKDLT